MKTTRNIATNPFLLMALSAMASSAIHANGAILLGTAGNFAVLAGSTITNTGSSIINGGDIGVSPGTAITGFPPGVVASPYTTHTADAVALQAQSDLATAYNAAAGLASTQSLTGQDLGGLTLTPGVYFVLLQSELDKGAFGVKDTMAPFLGVCLCPAPPVAVTPEVKRSLS